MPQDPVEVERLLRLAAEQGNIDAQYDLARLYYDGQGVPQDRAEAAKWYRLAADQGLINAREKLAHMHLDGDGVSQDDAEAARLFRPVAELGFAAAQANLGMLYAQGRGVPLDYVHALAWFNLSASRLEGRSSESGEKMSPEEIPIVRQYESGVARYRTALVARMTPEQIAEAEVLAPTLVREPNRASVGSKG